MESEEITIEYEGEEFAFRLQDPGIIHIYVKEIWWSVDERIDEIEPYIQALEEYQKRLEALRANGWTITTGDGEHLYFENDDIGCDSSSDWEINEQLE